MQKDTTQPQDPNDWVSFTQSLSFLTKLVEKQVEETVYDHDRSTQEHPPPSSHPPPNNHRNEVHHHVTTQAFLSHQWKRIRQLEGQVMNMGLHGPPDSSTSSTTRSTSRANGTHMTRRSTSRTSHTSRTTHVNSATTVTSTSTSTSTQKEKAHPKDDSDSFPFRNPEKRSSSHSHSYSYVSSLSDVEQAKNTTRPRPVPRPVPTTTPTPTATLSSFQQFSELCRHLHSFNNKHLLELECLARHFYSVDLFKLSMTDATTTTTTRTDNQDDHNHHDHHDHTSQDEEGESDLPTFTIHPSVGQPLDVIWSESEYESDVTRSFFSTQSQNKNSPSQSKIMEEDKDTPFRLFPLGDSHEILDSRSDIHSTSSSSSSTTSSSYDDTNQPSLDTTILCDRKRNLLFLNEKQENVNVQTRSTQEETDKDETTNQDPTDATSHLPNQHWLSVVQAWDTLKSNTIPTEPPRDEQDTQFQIDLLDTSGEENVTMLLSSLPDTDTTLLCERKRDSTRPMPFHEEPMEDPIHTTHPSSMTNPDEIHHARNTVGNMGQQQYHVVAHDSGEGKLSSSTTTTTTTVLPPLIPVLDRYQVQLFNKGQECKVFPLGDSITTIQSPILKIASPSPSLYYASQNRSSTNTSHPPMTPDESKSISNEMLAQSDTKHLDLGVILSTHSSTHSTSSSPLLTHSAVVVDQVNNMSQVFDSPKSMDTLNRLRSDQNVSELLAKTPIAAAWIAKHYTHEKDKIIDLLSAVIVEPPPSVVKDPSLVVDSNSLEIKTSHCNMLLQELSTDEYDAAPRLVKMQVSLDEINQGIQCMNDWLKQNVIHQKENDQTRIVLTEQDSYEALRSAFDERKCKSILMSLVHFRKMVMRLPTTGQGKLFLLQSQGNR